MSSNYVTRYEESCKRGMNNIDTALKALSETKKDKYGIIPEINKLVQTTSLATIGQMKNALVLQKLVIEFLICDQFVFLKEFVKKKGLDPEVHYFSSPEEKEVINEDKEDILYDVTRKINEAAEYYIADKCYYSADIFDNISKIATVVSGRIPVRR